MFTGLGSSIASKIYLKNASKPGPQVARSDSFQFVKDATYQDNAELLKQRYCV